MKGGDEMRCPTCGNIMTKGIKFLHCPVCRTIILRIKTQEEFEEIANEKKDSPKQG